MKQEIENLNQAEDRDIGVTITIDGLPIDDVKDAFMEIRSLSKVLMVRIEMSTGHIVFAASMLTVHLTETTSANLVGKYNYELWFKDSNEIDTLASYGTLQFNATFGRFN